MNQNSTDVQFAGQHSVSKKLRVRETEHIVNCLPLTPVWSNPNLSSHLCAVAVKAQKIHVRDGAAGSGRVDSAGVVGGVFGLTYWAPLILIDTRQYQFIGHFMRVRSLRRISWLLHSCDPGVTAASLLANPVNNW